jgi:hypothetical protein
LCSTWAEKALSNLGSTLLDVYRLSITKTTWEHLNEIIDEHFTIILYHSEKVLHGVTTLKDNAKYSRSSTHQG